LQHTFKVNTDDLYDTYVEGKAAEVDSFWKFTDGTTDRVGTIKTSGKIYVYDSASKDFKILEKSSKFHSIYNSLSKDSGTGRLKFTFPASYDC
jgi:hypothetical protein